MDGGHGASAFAHPTGNPSSDRDNLDRLIAGGDHVSDTLAHHGPRHRRDERNRAGLWIGLVLSDDTIGLLAPVGAAEGHGAAEGDNLGAFRRGDDLRRADAL